MVKKELEKKFHIHPDLKKALLDMEKHCPVSRALLEIKTTDELPRYVNYLGISEENNSFISYLDDKRYFTCIEKYTKKIDANDLCVGSKVRLLSKGLSTFNFYAKKNFNRNNLFIIDCIEDTHYGVRRHNSEGGMWHVNKKEVRSYGKMTNFYVPSIRYHMSCVKFVKRIFDNKFTEQQYSDFCSNFKMYHPSSDYMGRFTKEFVSGENIRYWYNSDKYAEGGSLGNSCMRYSKCYDWLKIYSDNPETVQLFILKTQDNLLAGRCLVWGGKYFDRVYGINNDVEKGIIKHLSDCGFTDIYADDFDECITYKLNHYYDYYDSLPYMDTFKYYYGKEITNNVDSYADRVMNSANGQWEGYEEENPQVYCIIDNEYYDEDECYWFDHRDGWVHNSNTVYCGCVGERWPSDEVTTLYNGRCAPNDKVVELFNGDYAYYNDDDLYTDVDGDYFIYGRHDFVEVNDEYYPNDDDRICLTNEGKYMLKSECVDIDGSWYDKDDCYYSEKYGWTLEEMKEEIETENPLQLK